MTINYISTISHISSLQTELGNTTLLVTRYEPGMDGMVPGAFLHGYKAAWFKG